MNSTQQTFMEEIDKEHRSVRVVRNDSWAEGIVGGCVVVLTIIGLLNIRPDLMLAVAVIAMGTAFLLEGEGISKRVSRLLAKLSKGSLQDEQPRVGVTAEFIAGVSGIALGFLAFLGLYPLVMVPAAVILYGSALVFGSGLTARLNDLENESFGEPSCFKRVVCEAMSAASGVELALGLSAGILGIVALTGMEAVRTSLAALLIVGAGSFLNGAAIVARIAGTHKS